MTDKLEPCTFCYNLTVFTVLDRSLVCCVECYYKYRVDAEEINKN